MWIKRIRLRLRTSLVLQAIGALLLAVGGGVWWYVTGPIIPAAKLQQLYPGMPMTEVEAILGEPTEYEPCRAYWGGAFYTHPYKFGSVNVGWDGFEIGETVEGYPLIEDRLSYVYDQSRRPAKGYTDYSWRFKDGEWVRR